VRPCLRGWRVWNMLPEKMKEVLIEYGKSVNPAHGCIMCGFKVHLDRYERYFAFLEACGHDKQELFGALTRTKAAVQDLKHVNEWITEKFKEHPFPITEAETSEVKPDESAD
jgi:hypothetical protein